MKQETMTAAQYQAKISQPQNKGSKYGNVWTEVDGIKFQSKAEATYYGKLKILLKGKKIKGFSRQVVFRIVVNGIFICNYRADFVVEYMDGVRHVVDVKGEATENIYSFQIKKKLLKALYNIDLIIAK